MVVPAVPLINSFNFSALPIITENTIEIDSAPELNMAQALISMNPVIFTRIFGDQ